MGHWDLLDISDAGYAYIIIGGFVVTFSMVSLVVKEKLYINEVVLGTAFGIVVGPYAANIFDPRSWTSDSNTLTLEIMRVVLASGLFAIGVELPQSYMAKNAKSLLVMVVPTMAIGWVISAAFIHMLFPELDYISSLLISACLTPTDPIICAAIVGGKFAVKHVPLNLRQLLAAESASNDGLAYPFLSIATYLLTESRRGVAVEKWFLIGWLYQVFLGTFIGAITGLLFSHLMQFAETRGLVDRESYIAQYIALTLLTIGITRTLGSDDLLAAFAAGTAISWDGHFNHQVEGELFSSILDLMLNCACFIYIGAWVPFNQFNVPELGLSPSRLIALFLIILGLRRIPSVLLLYKWIPEIGSWRQALFTGHFGPMGVGAVFISTLALIRLEDSNVDSTQIQLLKETLQPIVSFVVLCSIVVHGLSIPCFNFGSQTLTLSRSVTRTLTRTGDVPDWLLWAHRAPYPAQDSSTADPERGTSAARGDATDDGFNAPVASNASAVTKVYEAHEETAIPEVSPLSPPTTIDSAAQPIDTKPCTMPNSRTADDDVKSSKVAASVTRPDGQQRAVRFPSSQ